MLQAWRCWLRKTPMRISPEARAGHISVTSYFSTLNVPANSAFRRGFRSCFGEEEEPGVYSEVCYSQVHMFAGAVRQAGSDETDALLSALSGAVLKGPAGDLFLRLHVHGVLSKPIRLFGVLAALTTAISLSRHESRLNKRVKSLDETLKARRKIERAVQILAESRSLSETEAYKRIRERSMQSKESIASISDAIIAAHEI